MNPCSRCKWYRRLSCIFACAEFNDILARIDRLLKGEG